MSKILMIITLLLVIFAWNVWANDVPLKVYETIIYESAGEPLEGQIAVAKVIMNRMKQRHLSALKVVLQPYQFSCWNKGAVRREYKDYEMVNAIRAWELAKNSKLNVNHYHADYCNAYWAPKMEFVTQIGKHLFYTDR